MHRNFRSILCYSEFTPNNDVFDTVSDICQHLRSMNSGVFCLAIRRSDVLQSVMFGMERIAFSLDKAMRYSVYDSNFYLL